MNEKIVFVITLIFLLLLLISYKAYNISKMHLDIKILLLLILLSYFYLATRYFVWEIYTRKIKERSFTINFLIAQTYFGLQFVPAFLGSFLFAKNLPQILAKIKKHAPSITISAGMSSVLALALLATIFSIIVVPSFVLYTLALLGILYLVSSLLGTNFFWNKFIRLVKLIKNERINKTLNRNIDLIKKTRAFLRQKDIAIITLAYIPSYLFEGAIFFFAFYALGVRADPLILLFIFYFADTIGVVTNLPAALGSFDITAITLSEILAGIPGITSLSAIIIFRLFNLIEPAIIGYLSYLVFSKFYEQRLVQRRRATRS